MTYVEISFMTFLITKQKTDIQKKSLALEGFQMQETVYETVVKETVYEINLNFQLPTHKPILKISKYQVLH